MEERRQTGPGFRQQKLGSKLRVGLIMLMWLSNSRNVAFPSRTLHVSIEAF